MKHSVNKILFIPKYVFGDKLELISKKLADRYGFFKNFGDHSKPLTDLKNEKFSLKLTGKKPNREDITTIDKIIEQFDLLR